MNDNHEEGFRASHLAALARCIHHTGKDIDSGATTRGTGSHARIAAILRDAQRMGDLDACDPADEPDVQYAISVVNEYLAKNWSIKWIEEDFDFTSDDGEQITRCTPDLVLEHNEANRYLVIDWKTGDKGDYDIQNQCYQIAVADFVMEGDVSGLIVYTDLRETKKVPCDYGKIAHLILRLFDQWNEQQGAPYKINEYCSWCALRPECPAWKEQFDLALKDVAALDISGSRVVETLKNDPERLEEFLLQWERALTLMNEWKLREALQTHMETGYKAESFSLVKVAPISTVTHTVDPEQFLIYVAKEIGTSRAAQAISVDADQAKAAWEGFITDKSFPIDIQDKVTEKSGYSYIRLKGKPGKGEAAKKRKEISQ